MEIILIFFLFISFDSSSGLFRLYSLIIFLPIVSYILLKNLHLDSREVINDKNYKELYKYILHGKYTSHTKSDCEVIVPLYNEYNDDFFELGFKL